MQWVLYNAASEKGNIKSQSGDAYVRILGFFLLKIDALNHANDLNHYLRQKGQPKLEIRIAKTNEFRMLLNMNYSDMTISSVLQLKEVNKLKSLLAFHDEYLKKQKLDVEYRSQNKIAGDFKLNVEERRDYYKSILVESSNINTAKPQEEHEILGERTKQIPLDFTLRNQNFCLLAHIKDYVNEMNEETNLDTWKMELHAIKNKYRNEMFINILKENPEFKPITIKEFFRFEHDENKINNEMYDDYYKSLFNATGGDFIAFMNGLDKIEKEYILQNPVPEQHFYDEPAVAFLGAGNTEHDLQAWIKKNEHVAFLKEFDVACVSMYEWIKIKNFTNMKIKKEYKDNFLNTLQGNMEKNELEKEKIGLH